MSTIKDIAAQAGVSKSTVSRVLTNTGYVNEETRRRITNIINETGYQPSASARTLSTKTTNTIGVVVPELGNTFYADVLNGITQVVGEKDLTIIYCNTDNDAQKEAKALETLVGQRVQGVILAPAVDYSRPEAALRLSRLLGQINAPVVLVDRDVENSQMDNVVYDNYGSAYAATEELIKAGNKTIGMITGDMSLNIARDRYNGFLSAMFDYGKKVENKYIYYGNFELQKAYELSCQMYDSKNVPDGIITSNNETTLGLLRATRERGLRFGRDIAVIAVDHIDVLDIIDYYYSYVTRDMVGMGRKAMELLLQRMEHPEMEKQSIVMPYKMVLKGAERKRMER